MPIIFTGNVDLIRNKKLIHDVLLDNELSGSVNLAYRISNQWGQSY